MRTRSHTRVTGPDSDKFGGSKILVFKMTIVAQRQSRSKGASLLRVRLPPIVSISINEPPLALLLRRDPRTNEILLCIFFKEKRNEKIVFYRKSSSSKRARGRIRSCRSYDEQKRIWASIPKTGISAHIAGILKVARDSDAVVVVGEPRACYIVVSAVGKDRCFSTYSVRQSIDEPQPDGSVIKKAVFKFDGLVRYE